MELSAGKELRHFEAVSLEALAEDMTDVFRRLRVELQTL